MQLPGDISLDTETTGIDWKCGASPFLVTISHPETGCKYWEWDVDPYTRKVTIPQDDRDEIFEEVSKCKRLITQNGKFDAAALHYNCAMKWPWEKAEDTLIASHLLSSNTPHDLTSLVKQYLGVDLLPFESKLEVAVKKARAFVAQSISRAKRYDRKIKTAKWSIASSDNPLTPSAKASSDEDKSWKFDMWILRALIVEYGGVDRLSYEFNEDVSSWETLLSDYANSDSLATLRLWYVLEDKLKARDLPEIYREGMRTSEVLYNMELRGVSMNIKVLDSIEEEFKTSSREAGEVCTNLANDYGYTLSLPSNGVNNSLREFCFEVLNLPPIKNPKSKTDAPTLDAKNAIPYYLRTFSPDTPEHLFISKLVTKRARDTGLSFISAYRKFAHIPEDETGDWAILHPWFNLTGTDTIRMSCKNPNAQQISKKEEVNLRKCFGPAPGREWWSFDAENIELRIPAYESGEQSLIELFERPDDPPFYGSEHLLVASVLFPMEFAECKAPLESFKGVVPKDPRFLGVDGRIFKKRYKDTLYQRIKNGNFAVQYGAVDRADGMGTADRTYGIAGAQALLKERFARKEALNQKWISFARRYGYIETIPDRSVNPRRGYPLLCRRSIYGDIVPTIPLNYHIQGTAGMWMRKALCATSDLLKKWRREEGYDGYLILTVHDELVFDLPCDPSPRKRWGLTDQGIPVYNLEKIKQLREAMRKGGDDFGIPTPVKAEYHSTSWGEGISL